MKKVMQRNKSRKPSGLMLNASSGWVTIFVGQLIALIITPFLINALGTDAYGVWLVLLNLSALFNLLDIGISSALVSYIASYMSTNDYIKARNITSTSLCIFVTIGAACMVVFCCLAYFIDDLFNIPEKLVFQSRIVLIALGVVITTGFPMRSFESILYALEYIFIANLIDTVRVTLRFIVLLIVVSQTNTLFALGIAHSITFLAINFLTIFIAIHYCPSEIIPRFKYDKPSARRLMVFGRDSVAISLGGRVVKQGALLVLGGLSHAKEVTNFGIATRLMINEIVLLQSAASVAQPRFASLKSVNKTSDIHNVLFRTTVWLGLAAVLIGLGLWFLGGSFVKLWVGSSFQEAIGLLNIMIIPVTIALMVQPCLVLLLGIKKHFAAGIMSLIESAIILGLCYLLIPQYGAVGAAISVAVGMSVLRITWLPVYTCRRCGISAFRLFYRGFMPPMLVAVVSGLLFFWAFQYLTIDTWFRFVCASLGMTLVFALLAWFIALGKNDHEVIKDKLSSLKNVLSKS